MSLTDPSSRRPQLYKTMAQSFPNHQQVELSQVRECVIIKMDMCTVTGAPCRLEPTTLPAGGERGCTIVLCNCELLMMDQMGRNM
jgi:hypothetical protein